MQFEHLFKGKLHFVFEKKVNNVCFINWNDKHTENQSVTKKLKPSINHESNKSAFIKRGLTSSRLIKADGFFFSPFLVNMDSKKKILSVFSKCGLNFFCLLLLSADVLLLFFYRFKN
jgi:hypothetical protein